MMSERHDPDARRSFDSRIERAYRQAVRARALLGEITEVAEAIGAKLADAAEDDSGPMDALASALGLTADQRDLVWCVVACSYDPRIVPYLEVLAGAHARRGLSVTAYVDLAELDERCCVSLALWLASPANPLVATGLLSATEQASPAARAYVASPRLVSYLAGEEASIEPLRIVRANRNLLHDARQVATIGTIATALAQGPAASVIIEGPAGSGRTTACACAVGQDMLVLDCKRITTGELRDALMVLRRELLLRGGVPVIANADYVLGDDQRDQRKLLGAFIDQHQGPLVATVTVAGTDLNTERAVIRIRWGVPDSDVRAQLWTAAVRSMGASLEGDVVALAYRYGVGPAAIERAVTSVRLLRPRGGSLDEAALSAGLRHNITERLGGLARRVDVTQTWNDLVAADDLRDQITALIDRVRHAHQVFDQWGFRAKLALGAGVVALFSGLPGTGKTMVAGLIARELDLELYQVDLSKVVSKWVGETEKNLARVFDAAEDGHALLLFDEADALFGQRSGEIRSANDRYANLEVNYLLQRVEAFGGMTILTTNLDTAIDEAFKRRLASHIVFEKPDEEERAMIWERQLTTGRAPVNSRVDYARLARDFPQMSGANIRNAVIAAAFLTAGEKAPEITEEHLLRATRVEYRSMGHVLADSLGKRGRNV